MRKHLKRMIQFLSIHGKLHDQLLDICRLKQVALTANALDDINAILIKEEKVAGKLHDLEQQRIRFVGDMHQKFYPDQKTICLETIIRYAMEPEKQELSELHASLKQKTAALQNANRLNASLCKQGLNTITYYLNVMTAAAVKDNTQYNMHARQSEPKRMNLLDQTA